MRKKLALVYGVLATAGLLFLGCSKEHMDKNLRKDVYSQLTKIPENSYTIHTKKHTIIAKAEPCFPSSGNLEVEISNKDTGDVLYMVDEEVVVWGLIRSVFGLYSSREGIDKVEYNGLKNSTAGMETRFDKALKILKPKLKERIDQEIYSVKENTRL